MLIIRLVIGQKPIIRIIKLFLFIVVHQYKSLMCITNGLKIFRGYNVKKNFYI